jgi:hypothetical protein
VSRPPSPRRFAVWAGFLVLPLVLAAVAYPWLSRRLGPGGGEQAIARAAGAARTAEAAAAAVARQADAALGEGGAAGSSGASRPAGAAPRRPEGPTTAEIEAARAAEVEAARAQRGWQKAEVLAPREARRDAGGELVAPFHGFGLSVESSPPGAGVRVAGREVGETPLVTSVACQPGAPVEVRVERRPYAPQVRTVRCRADTLLTVQVTLTR